MSTTSYLTNVNYKDYTINYLNLGDSTTNTNIDWSVADLQELNLVNGTNISFSGSAVGQKSTLLLRQENSDVLGINWPSNVFWNNNEPLLLSQLPNSAGLIDNSVFLTNFDGDVYSMALQPDGKILMGGAFTAYGFSISNRIVRLNSVGIIDTTFSIGDGFNGTVYSIVYQLDGKMLVGGSFTDYDSNIASYIIRLNSDGSIDGDFTIGAGFDGDVYSIVLQPDGKILVGGNFASYDGNNADYIIRLNSDGSIDNTFVTGGGFNGPVYSIVLQPDGKILAVGTFSNYGGNTSNFIVRLNSDGSIDNTFVTGDGFSGDVVKVVILQPDGKILVGGFFGSYDGVSSKSIIRLNSDGSIDNTFVTGDGFNAGVYSIVLQPDGKILMGGAFTDYNSSTFNRIIRLDSDGSVDNTFVIGSGFDNDIYSIVLQPDNKILVGGKADNYNGNSIGKFTRLTNDPFRYNKVDFIYTGTNYIGSY